MKRRILELRAINFNSISVNKTQGDLVELNVSFKAIVSQKEAKNLDTLMQHPFEKGKTNLVILEHD